MPEYFNRPLMKALFLTNEYPPTIYGGAGVHVAALDGEVVEHPAIMAAWS